MPATTGLVFLAFCALRQLGIWLSDFFCPGAASCLRALLQLRMLQAVLLEDEVAQTLAMTDGQ